MNNMILIIDWDDTLFPTTWVNSKNINITDTTTCLKYKSYFDNLDDILYLFLKNIFSKKLRKQIIVTNASKKWILDCYNLLPKSKLLLVSNIDLISARDLHYMKHPNPDIWKKLVFKDIHNSNKDVKTIISIGDADYEYRALINLYNNVINLKAVRLLNKPDVFKLCDQMATLNRALSKIIYSSNNLDIYFINK